MAQMPHFQEKNLLPYILYLPFIIYSDFKFYGIHVTSDFRFFLQENTVISCQVCSNFRVMYSSTKMFISVIWITVHRLCWPTATKPLTGQKASLITDMSTQIITGSKIKDYLANLNKAYFDDYPPSPQAVYRSFCVGGSWKKTTFVPLFTV